MAGPVAPQFAITPNYCLSGFYRGYRGDSADGTGVTAQQMTRFATLSGWTPEVAGVFGGLNSSVNNLAQHIIYHQRGFPKSSGTGSYTRPGSLHLMATNPDALSPNGTQTYRQYWRGTVDSLKAIGKWTSQVTIGPMWEGSGGGGWGGMRDNGGIDPFTGVANTNADFAGAFRNLVLEMRSYASSLGLDPLAVTWDWNVFSGGITDATMEAMYPGDDVVDFIGWDGYGTNPESAAYMNKNDWSAIYTKHYKPWLDQVTAFAVKHGKRAGMGEMGVIGYTPTDSRLGTSSDFTLTDSAGVSYFQTLAPYLAANANIWAYVSVFNESQHTNFAYDGSQPISEDDQLVYFGTDPSTQTYPYLYSTNNTGVAYKAPSSSVHPLTAQAWLDNLKSGTLQLPPAVVPTPPPTFQISPAQVDSQPYLMGGLFG